MATEQNPASQPIDDKAAVSVLDTHLRYIEQQRNRQDALKAAADECDRLRVIIASKAVYEAQFANVKAQIETAKSELASTVGLIARAKKEAEDHIAGGREARDQIIQQAQADAAKVVADLNAQIAAKRGELADVSDRVDRARTMLTGGV